MKLQIHTNLGLIFGLEYLTHMIVIELGFFGIVFNWQEHYCLDCNQYRLKAERKDEFYCNNCLPNITQRFQI